MKRIAGVLLLVSIAVAAGAKEPDIAEPAIKRAVEKADSCSSSGMSGCAYWYQKAITEGERQKVSYLDYLYYKKGFYYFRNAQHDSALHYFDLVLKHTHDDEAIESALNHKAGIYYDQGKTTLAVQLLINIARRVERRKDNNKLAYTYLNIGNLLYSQDNKQQSLQYMLKSYTLLNKIGDTMFIGTAAGNIADSYYDLGNEALAREWAEKTLAIKNYSRDQTGRVIAYKTLAQLSMRRNPDSAIQFIRKGIALAEKNHNRTELGNLYAVWATTYDKARKYREAIQAIEKAIRLHRDGHFVPGLANDLQLAGEITLKGGQYEKSARYFYESRQLSDSLKSKQRFEVINELTTKYETEKKEKLLALQQLTIQRKNTQIRNWLISLGAALLLTGIGLLQYRRVHRLKSRQAERDKENAVLKARMNGEERERGRISRELHDGAASMLAAAKMSLEAIPYLTEDRRRVQVEKVVGMLARTQTDVRRIAHDLLPVALQEKGLLPAIRQYVADINDAGIIELRFEEQTGAGPEPDQQTSLLLYRIVQELVNNILKHSGASTGVIKITIDDKQLSIVVADNGKGMSGNRSGQGLYTIRERMEAIGGYFSIDSGTEGTCAELKLVFRRAGVFP